MIPILIWHIFLLSILIGFIGFVLYVFSQEIREYLKKKRFFKEYDKRCGEQVDTAFQALKKKEGEMKRRIIAEFEGSINLTQFITSQLRQQLKNRGAKSVKVQIEKNELSTRK